MVFFYLLAVLFVIMEVTGVFEARAAIDLRVWGSAPRPQLLSFDSVLALALVSTAPTALSLAVPQGDALRPLVVATVATGLVVAGALTFLMTLGRNRAVARVDRGASAAEESGPPRSRKAPQP